ncbi:MAG: hypothetical protein JXA18_00455 [Chitinispirillaceae bacterium]|nr:hypothetical protein [Chitinispirillaceae bacterium]
MPGGASAPFAHPIDLFESFGIARRLIAADDVNVRIKEVPALGLTYKFNNAKKKAKRILRRAQCRDNAGYVSSCTGTSLQT